MKASILVSAAALLLAASAAPPAVAADPPESVGTVVNIEGTVTAALGGDAQPRDLKLKSPVFASDVVTTSPGSRLEVLFDGDVMWVLDEDSRAEITEIIYRPRKRVFNGIFTLRNGRARFNLERKFIERSYFKCKTGNAIAGVKGTDFTVTYNPAGNETRVAVFEGSVEVENMRGSSTLLMPDQFTEVTQDEAPTAPRPLSPGMRRSERITVASSPRSPESGIPGSRPLSRPLPGEEDIPAAGVDEGIRAVQAARDPQSQIVGTDFISPSTLSVPPPGGLGAIPGPAPAPAGPAAPSRPGGGGNTVTGGGLGPT